MDPITSLVSGHVAGKVLDYVSSQFKTSVIERWAKRRAETFFEEFCREVELERGGEDSAKVNALLAHMLDDETCSEVLFDAYRRVSLTKSKELGPRIIGIVTADLVLKGQVANDVEDTILSAAESLTDAELLDFANFVRDQRRRAADELNKEVSFNQKGDLRIEWCKEEYDSNWNKNSDVSLGPLNLDECLGHWASRIKSCGILSDDVKERQWDYDEDSELHIDMPGSVREISWWLYIPCDYLRLADLIDRVSRIAAIKT